MRTTEFDDSRNMMEERRKRNYAWKLRRRKQIRRNLICMVLALVLTSALIIGIVLSFRMTSNAQPGKAELSFKYYTSIEVAEGETLWSIAECHADAHYADIRDYVDEVVRINHLWDEDRLLAGQRLIIPYYSEEYKK